MQFLLLPFLSTNKTRNYSYHFNEAFYYEQNIDLRQLYLLLSLFKNTPWFKQIYIYIK